MAKAWLPKKGLGPISPASGDSYVKIGGGAVLEMESDATEVLRLNSMSASLATLAMTGVATGSNTIDGKILISDGTNDVWIPTMSTVIA